MLRILKPAVAMVMLLASAPMALGDPGIVAPFEGVWIGNSVVVEQQSHGPAVTASDISVTIRATEPGFEITWKPLRHGEAAWMTAQFVAAAEPGTFEFAGVNPPLRGNESLWAEIEGDQLAVYLVGVGSDLVGRYLRSVNGNRMTFSYTLSRGGEIVDSMTGTLTRAKVVL